MAGRTYKRLRDRPDPRTPVQIDPDVYQWARKEAKKDGRTITNFINHSLRQIRGTE